MIWYELISWDQEKEVEDDQILQKIENKFYHKLKDEENNKKRVNFWTKQI